MQKERIGIIELKFSATVRLILKSDRATIKMRVIDSMAEHFS